MHGWVGRPSMAWRAAGAHPCAPGTWLANGLPNGPGSADGTSVCTRMTPSNPRRILGFDHPGKLPGQAEPTQRSDMMMHTTIVRAYLVEGSVPRISAISGQLILPRGTIQVCGCPVTVAMHSKSPS